MKKFSTAARSCYLSLHNSNRLCRGLRDATNNAYRCRLRGRGIHKMGGVATSWAMWWRKFWLGRDSIFGQRGTEIPGPFHLF